MRPTGCLPCYPPCSGLPGSRRHRSASLASILVKTCRSFPKVSGERFLQPDEIGRFFEALEAESPLTRD